MNRFASLALLVAGGTLVAAPGVARAQFPSRESNAASFGVTGGLAAPLGRLRDNLNSGYSVGGLVDLRPVPGPLSLRLEVGYDQFNTEAAILAGLADQIGANISANTHYLRGTANVVYRLSNVGGVRPYLTGGVGVYQNSSGASFDYQGTTVTQSDQTRTKFGVNGGVGVELPLSGISVFLEARAHGVQTNGTPVTYVPITAGIRF